MHRVNLWSLIVAAVVAFLVGAIWYTPLLFGETWMQLRGIAPAVLSEMSVPPAEVAGELVRGLVVAYVLAHFIARAGIVGWMASLRLGFVAWTGFQATLLMGAVLHEDLPWGLYAIHAGDALVKMILMSVILGGWRPRRERT